MPNSYFQFKQFTIHQDRCAMKVTTDGCLFGAWVAKSLSVDSQLEVFDAGTGTGLLSLMLAQKHPALKIDSVEIDKEAYRQAKENVQVAPFGGGINVIHGDLRTFIFQKKYDIIISNPPFYEKEIKSGNEKKNMAHHHAALLIEELLSIIKKIIAPKGSFYLLLPFKRNKEIQSLLKTQSLFISQLILIRQSVNHDYFRIMLKGEMTDGHAETSIDEISIWNEQQQYTDAFRDLLKDYYLNL